MRSLILCMALVGVGVGGGYLLCALRAQPQPPAPVVRGTVERAPVVVTDRGLSEAELRRIVREELAAGRPGQDAASAPEPAHSAQPPGDPAALDEGMRRVAQAIAKRRWTPDDAVALERALEIASPEQRAAIFHTLIPAMNRGEIKLTYRGSLF